MANYANGPDDDDVLADKKLLTITRSDFSRFINSTVANHYSWIIICVTYLLLFI